MYLLYKMMEMLLFNKLYALASLGSRRRANRQAPIKIQVFECYLLTNELDVG